MWNILTSCGNHLGFELIDAGAFCKLLALPEASFPQNRISIGNGNQEERMKIGSCSLKNVEME